MFSRYDCYPSSNRIWKTKFKYLAPLGNKEAAIRQKVVAYQVILISICFSQSRLKDRYPLPKVLLGPRDSLDLGTDLSLRIMSLRMRVDSVSSTLLSDSKGPFCIFTVKTIPTICCKIKIFLTTFAKSTSLEIKF